MKLNIIGWLEKAYSHLPKLDSQFQAYVVSFLPALSLIFGLLLTLASVLELLGTSVLSLFSIKSGGLPVIQLLLLTNAIGVFQGILMVFAFGPLKARREKGWRLLVWSQILWIISAVLSLPYSAVIALILLYPIMAVRSEYK